MSDEEAKPSPAAQPAFEILLRAIGECLQQGRLDSAREILVGARAQADSGRRRAQVMGLEALLEERQEQRNVGATAAVAAIEEALAAGNRMTADRLLFQAGEELGDHPDLRRLQARLEAAHRRDFRADVRRLIEQADRVSEDGSDTEAHELLLKAQALSPAEDDELQRLLAEIGERVGGRTEKHRRQRIAAARRQITGCLEALDYPGARAVLQSLVGSLGSSDGLRELQSHLVATHQDVLNRRVREAGVAFEQGRFGEASLELRAALVLSPDNPWLQDRLAEAGQRLSEQEQQRRQDPGWLGVLAEIERLRVAGDFAAADRAVAEAERRWGLGGVLDEQRDEITRARRVHLADLLRAARRARGEGELDQARDLVGQVLAVDPANGEALHLAELIERSPVQEEVPEASPELAPKVAEIQRLRAGGEILSAWRQVQGAIDEHGDVEPLSTLRRLIADEMLASDGP